MCKNSISKMKSDSAIGQQFITNTECTKTYTDENVQIIGQARSELHLSLQLKLVTDHRPLEHMFDKTCSKSSMRLERWPYNFVAL